MKETLQELEGKEVYLIQESSYTNTISFSICGKLRKKSHFYVVDNGISSYAAFELKDIHEIFDYRIYLNNK